jgi:hypothetical protein
VRATKATVDPPLSAVIRRAVAPRWPISPAARPTSSGKTISASAGAFGSRGRNWAAMSGRPAWTSSARRGWDASTRANIWSRSSS